MKILALDSTALVASVALCEDEKLLGEMTVNNGNTHSQTLLPMVEFLLKQFDMTPNDVDLFAATIGPGSFTGVRIGAATLKGLAFGTNKPCIGVSTPEALAYNLRDFEGLICPVMNARRKQVYTALFRASGGVLERLMDDSAIAIAELDERLRAYGQEVSANLQKAEQEKMLAIQTALRNALDLVGKEGGFVCIFDLAGETPLYRSVPYISNTLCEDVSALVKAKLGIAANAVPAVKK